MLSLPSLRHTYLAYLLVLLFGALGAGVGDSQAQQRAVVLIETNYPEATVYADSVRLGPASLGTFLVPVETQQLRLVPPGGDAWSISPVEVAFRAEPGDTLDVELPFPYHYQIESIPYGAMAFLENIESRIALGRTPVLFESPDVLEGTFIIERQGYMPEELTPGNEVWNRYLLTLQPVRIEDVKTAEEDWRPPRKRRRWIDYTATVVAVTAGAAAVHYKFKADRLNDEYQLNGDPSLRPEIKSLDTRSGVALGVMQAGLGVLALRFVLK